MFNLFITISKKIILFLKEPNESLAYLGIQDKSKIYEETHQQTVYISKILVHEQYDSYTFENDIALLTTTKRIGYNKYISKIMLPLTSDSFVGKLATISGWGLTEHNDTPNILKYIRLPVIDNKQCEQKSSYVKSSTVCFEATNGMSTASGDSGGPWTINLKNSSILIGIHSFRSGTIMGAVRVSSYFSWIIINCHKVCGYVNGDDNDSDNDDDYY
jgi:secreted trypsin-like serine protease